MSTSSDTPRQVAVLVNASSGSKHAGALKIIADAAERAGYQLGSTLETKGSPLSALDAIAKQCPDAAIVMGGDGSQAAALSVLACPVLPLPGGTLNWLSRALLGDGEWQDLLQACLGRPRITDLSAGQIVEKANAPSDTSRSEPTDAYPFFLVAQFGGPTLFAKSREALRHGIYKRAWIAARTAWSRSFAYRLHSAELTDGRTNRPFSAIVANTALASNVHTDTSALEMAGFEVDSPISGAAVGFHAIVDDWRSAPHVTLSSRSAFHIHSNRSRVPVLLDGEPKWLRTPLRIEARENVARIWVSG